MDMNYYMKYGVMEKRLNVIFRSRKLTCCGIVNESPSNPNYNLTKCSQVSLFIKVLKTKKHRSKFHHTKPVFKTEIFHLVKILSKATYFPF